MYYRDMAKKKKHRNTANPELHKAMQELRRLSAAQPHADRRERRARSRKDALRKELKNFLPSYLTS